MSTSSPQRPSAFLAVAISLLAVTTAVAACKGKSSTTRSPAPVAATEGIGAIPVAARVVMGWNVPKLRDSSLVKRTLASAFARDPDSKAKIDALLAACHFDPARDLDAGVIGLGDPKQPTQVVLVARGRFDEAKLTACIQSSVADGGGTMAQITVGGAPAWKVKNGKTGEETYFAFSGANTVIVAASQEWLANARDPKAAKVGSNATLKGLLDKVDLAAAVWGAGLVAPDVGATLVALSEGAVKAPATAIYGHADFGDGIDLEVDLVMGSGADAKGLVEFGKKQIGQLALLAQAAGLGDVVSKIDMTASGDTARVTLKLGPADLAKLEAELDKQTPPPPQKSAAPESQPVAPPVAPPVPVPVDDQEHKGAPQ